MMKNNISIKFFEFFDKIKSFAASLVKGKNSGAMQFALVIAIILLANFATATCNLRADLTRAGSYSLSEESKSLVRNLQEKMTVKVFFSENLPAQHTAVFRYLADILSEYENYSRRGMFSFEFVPADELEREAQVYGIQPVQSQEFENDQTTLRSTYMGLVILHADLMEKINALTSTAGMEYEITSRMEKMNARVSGLLGLKDPITVRLYMDSRLKALPIRGLDTLEEEVKAAVDNVSKKNYGKLTLQTVDTATVNSAEPAAEYGLSMLKWNAGAGYGAGEGLLNIVMTSGSKFKVVELGLAQSLFGGYSVSGIDGLEDSLNDGVLFLVGENLRLGYVVSNGTVDIHDNRTREGGALFAEILRDTYELVEVNVETGEIPAGINGLIINGPREEFSKEAMYRIDQFLMAGNSALIFFDSFDEKGGGQNQFMMQQPDVVPVDTGLEDMIAAYGVEIGKDIVLDNNCAQVNLGNAITDYPALPIILKKGFNAKDEAVKFLNSAAFFKASSLSFDGDALQDKGIKVESLVASSQDSWLMTDNISFNPMFIGGSKPEDGFASYTLCAAATGRFESRFKNEPSPLADKSGGKLVADEKLNATVASGNTTLIVVGTSQITRSGFILDSRQVLAGIGSGEEAYSNELLLHGLVDKLAGNTYIPEMKSKSLAYNPIDKISDGGRFALKTLNIIGAPVLAAAVGLAMWRRRNVRKNAIRKQFAESKR